MNMSNNFKSSANALVNKVHTMSETIQTAAKNIVMTPKSFAKACALTVAVTSASGCMTYSPQQGREIGQGVGGIGGAVIGAMVGKAIDSDSRGLGRYVGPAAGAAAGVRIGGAAGEAWAENAGSCDQRIRTQEDLKNGRLESAPRTNDCRRRTSYPNVEPTGWGDLQRGR